MKKSYNPFKMWGSYFGIILFSAFIEFGWYRVFIDKTTQCINCGVYHFPFVLSNLRVAFWTILIGFLIGWGIHSFIRRLR